MIYADHRGRTSETIHVLLCYDYMDYTTISDVNLSGIDIVSSIIGNIFITIDNPNFEYC